MKHPAEKPLWSDEPPDGFCLLETIRWTAPEGFYLLDAHLARLQRSAGHFNIPLRIQPVREALDRHVEPHRSPRRVRLLVRPDGTPRIESSAISPEQAFMRHPDDNLGLPVKTLAFAPSPVRRSDVYLHHKTTHRAIYERARAETASADDAILHNELGEITETTRANLVLTKDGERLTPPVHCGLLGGTFRAHLLEQGLVREQILTPDDVRCAQALYTVNSVTGWVPARLIGL